MWLQHSMSTLNDKISHSRVDVSIDIISDVANIEWFSHLTNGYTIGTQPVSFTIAYCLLLKWYFSFNFIEKSQIEFQKVDKFPIEIRSIRKLRRRRGFIVCILFHSQKCFKTKWANWIQLKKYFKMNRTFQQTKQFQTINWIATYPHTLSGANQRSPYPVRACQRNHISNRSHDNNS